MGNIIHGSNAVFWVKIDGQDHFGAIQNFNVDQAWGCEPTVNLTGFVDLLAREAFDLAWDEAAGTIKSKENKKPMNNKQNVYEYVVVLRVTDVQEKAGMKDKIIINPTVMMAGSTKEVERIAIRAVDKEIDIAQVEVLVRPFADR